MTTLCFISARNLGDAVLHADLIRRLQQASFADRWIVWTFPAAKFLFEGLENTEIIASQFPIGATGSTFFKGGYRSFLAAVRTIRARKPDVALDVVGDFRERLALRLLGAPLLHSPEWETGHPFRHHNRMLPFKAGRALTIPTTLVNLYEAQQRMVTVLTQGRASAPKAAPAQFREGQTLQVGIHPSASATFKLWPEERWQGLIAQLNGRFPGSHFTLFGAPSERPALESLASGLTVSHELFTASLGEFRARLQHMDLLFGLDSFSVHLSHSLGVPSVVLVGANDPAIFTPPSATAVTHPGRCPHQPCGGRPQCVGTPFQYSCMIDISAADVMQAVPMARASGTPFSTTSALAP